MIKKFFETIGRATILVLFLAVFAFIASAWSEPGSAPPGGNVSAPLNTSGTTQTKTGKLLFTWFEDQNQTGYYVDPGGNSIFSRIYTTALDLSASFAGPISANGGISVDGNVVIDDGAGWHRTYGQTGWYNGTYGGGWFMQDTTWVRSYQNKSVYTGGQMRADAGFCIGGSCLTSWPSSAAEADTLQTVTNRGNSTSQGIISPVFYDYNDQSYYLDPAYVSYLNDIRPNVIYDRDNTSYYVDPASTSRLGAVDADSVTNRSGVRVYLCPAVGIAQCGRSNSTCNGQLTTASTCLYLTGSECTDNITEPCSYVGKLVQ